METVFTSTQPARMDVVPSLIRSITDCAEKQGIAEDRVREIELVVEEALVNICNYAYAGNSGDMEVICRADEYIFIMELIDAGVPFDATALAAPDITSEASDREIGGLGVFLMKQLSDEVTYRREDNRNILTITFRKAPVE